MCFSLCSKAPLKGCSVMQAVIYYYQSRRDHETEERSKQCRAVMEEGGAGVFPIVFSCGLAL